MPKVFEWKGWRFVFYSLDGMEPPHIHALKDGKEAKFWLADCTLARSRRCSKVDLRGLEQVVEEKREVFLERWREHFGD